MANLIALERASDNTFKKKVRNIGDKIKEGTVIVLHEANVKQPAENYGRGVVYLGHIPHGFYEDELQDYFCQFGKITNLKVARSAKTGKSKGYAYIEFQYSEVAKVVAETMHNYLMCNRLLKADYIPSEKINEHKFWGGDTAERYAKAVRRKKAIHKLNQYYRPKRVELMAKRSKRHISGVLGKLRSSGIEYNFQPTLIVHPQPSAPVMLLDESDEEVQFKVADTVRILRRPVSSASKEPTMKTLLDQEVLEKVEDCTLGRKQSRLSIGQKDKVDGGLDSTPSKKKKLATPSIANQKGRVDGGLDSPGKKEALTGITTWRGDTPHRTLTVQNILETSIQQTGSSKKKAKKCKVDKALGGITPSHEANVLPTVSIKKLVHSMMKKLQETVTTPRIAQ